MGTTGTGRDESAAVEADGERRGGTGHGGRDRSGGDRLRSVLLVVAVLVMVWLVFNVRLPSIDEIRSSVDPTSWGSRAAFVGLYAAVAVTPIPITVMAVSGGVVFGAAGGTVLSVIGVMLGSWIAYWLARALGSQSVSRLLGRHAASVEDRLDSDGPYAVLMLRLLPGLPYWPVNYGSGAFGVPQRSFLLASAISIVPSQFSLVAIGTFIAEPSLLHGGFVVTGWAVVLGMMVVAHRRHRRG